MRKTKIICTIGPSSESEEKLREMTQLITHRGPDSSGFFSDDYISMGFRRLSIIDIEETGDQPIYNEDGSLVIVNEGVTFAIVGTKLQVNSTAKTVNRVKVVYEYSFV